MQRRVVESSMVERRFRIVEESIVILVVGEGGGGNAKERDDYPRIKET